ncbi:MAG: hypothetical protein NC237_09685 [Eubacterium sp.]|nr:hypothetical protein [Eubacterium sp.]MCM1419620.1 hypothetical protein [Roseburia sp.]
MSYGELVAVAARYAERERRESETMIRAAAFSAYHAAYLSRVKASAFPRSVVKAFPTLFGRSESGNIPVENWRESKRAMARFAQAYRGKFGGGEKA